MSKFGAKNRIVDLRKAKTIVQTARLEPVRTAQPTRRRVSLRSRRLKLRFILIGFFVALCIAMAFVVSYLSYLPQYNIQSVKVEGSSHVPAIAISAFIDSTIHPSRHAYLSRSNIFLFDPHALELAITQRFPWIAETHLTRDSFFSTNLTVSITERESFALWCLSIDSTSTPCYEMDKNGYIFSPVDSTNVNKRATGYLFTGGLPTEAEVASPIGDVFAPGHFSAVFAFLQFLSLDGFSPIGASVVSDTDFTVPLSAGYYLKASFNQNPEDLVKNLQLILASQALKNKQDNLLYIDLRFGDRVYYKFRPAENTHNTSQLESVST